MIFDFEQFLEKGNENKPQVSDEADARKTGKWREEAGLLATPPEGNFPMQNVGPVKFEVPTVPVIFILGKKRQKPTKILTKK